MKRRTGWMVLALFVVAGVSTVATAETATQPDPAATTAAALAKLQSIAVHNKLDLSNAAGSAADRFCIEMQLVAHPEGVALPMRILLIRDKDRVAVVTQDSMGRCLFFTTHGLALAVDYVQPDVRSDALPAGDLIRFSKSEPFFNFEAKDDRVGLNFGNDRTLNTPHVEIGYSSLLRSVISTAVSATCDDSGHRFVVVGPHSTTTLVFATMGSDGAMTLKSYLNERTGESMHISQLGFDAIPAELAPLLRDAGAIDGAVAKQGIKIENGDAKSEAEAGKIMIDAFFVPERQKNNPAVNTLLAQLPSALLGSPATQPAAP